MSGSWYQHEHKSTFFFYSYLDCFWGNLCDVSDEQGKRFYQDIKGLAEKYQGRWGKILMKMDLW